MGIGAWVFGESIVFHDRERRGLCIWRIGQKSCILGFHDAGGQRG